MQYFFLTATFIGILMAIMAIGVIFSNRELKGSCGGVNRCLCEETGREMPDACKQIKDAVERMRARQAEEAQNNLQS